MNDGTMSLQENLEFFKKELQKMQRDITHGHKKPHKSVMLLAVLNLFDRKIIIENKIYFNDDLAKSFSNIFNLIRIEGDWNCPVSELVGQKGQIVKVWISRPVFGIIP